MFISSYATYVDTKNIQKSSSSKDILSSNADTKSFKLFGNSASELKESKNQVVDYTSNNKVLSTKQKLQDASLYPQKQEFTKNKTIQNAKTAYEDNSKMFSLFVKPKATQGEVPIAGKNNQKVAINTYLENDRYHQITA